MGCGHPIGVEVGPVLSLLCAGILETPQDHVTRWNRLRTTTAPATFRQKQEHLKKCYNLVRTVIGYQGFAEIENEQLPSILLSIHMLLYVIAKAFCSPFKTLQTDLGAKSTQLLVERMVLNNGWCRKRLNFLNSMRLLYPALYFMASFRPKRAQTENHQSCIATKCHVAAELAQSHHRKPACRCQDLHVPLEQVLKIVGDGGIPLIRIVRSTSSGRIAPEVVPYTRTIDFVAISHVWADRQFGSSQNSLPTCHFQYINSVLAQIPFQRTRVGEFPLFGLWRNLREIVFNDLTGASRPIEPRETHEYFWLDTFCIPQDPKHNELKNKAIGSMNLIYVAASNTLVFDTVLQNMDGGQRPVSMLYNGQPTFYAPANESLLDVTAHIVVSKWIGRAWTLQEGVLSGFLVFPLKGSLAFLRLLTPNFDKLFNNNPSPLRPQGPLSEDVRHCLLEILNKALNTEEHRNYARGTTDRATRFINAHSRLQSRTTTMTQDLPLILFNMSGLNGNVMSQFADAERKMKILIYSVGKLPIELLFSGLQDSVPMRPTPGYRSSSLQKHFFKARFETGEGLSRIVNDGADKDHGAPTQTCIPRRADSATKFILERSQPTTEYLSMACPQNPKQFSDRFVAIGQFLYFGCGYIERRILRWTFGDENNIGRPLSLLYFCYKSAQIPLLERALIMIGHSTWLKTYSPTWIPTGPCKWFWKLSNYEPPIPLKTMNKIFLKIMFNVAFAFGAYNGLAMISLYWVVPYPGEELLAIFATQCSFITQINSAFNPDRLAERLKTRSSLSPWSRGSYLGRYQSVRVYMPEPPVKENDRFIDLVRYHVLRLWHYIGGHRARTGDVEEITGHTSYNIAPVAKVGWLVEFTLTSTLPVLAMFALNSVRNTKYRIAMSARFTVIFAAMIALFTDARRIEIFAATVTFAAVDVVFIRSALDSTSGGGAEDGLNATISC
ncbi:hypothetical protein QBC38DRAFT_503780 [Podospora fimiseda]|uniref:Heterokaryon incompatibility domain-containing protein n=1 Tax=Podospora fimiseda TaxID=252190 RepID=A0AAN7BFZ6_9PEZI|nr:hypothetical protein QBC38DRAFT_503780 [Podospora fimiseda]